MSQPNILILHTDQQRFDTINALGHTHVDTPNMNRLVQRGTAFTRAFSSNPVCMAARWYNGGEEWLFNNHQDPWEQENILDQEQDIANDLRQACLDFEKNEGIAQNVENNAFVNLPYQSPNPHTSSLHPTWSSRQYPPWTKGYSTEDLTLIANEMRNCLNSETVFIHKDPKWRNDAIQAWTDMGGDATVIQNIFKEADQTSK